LDSSFHSAFRHLFLHIYFIELFIHISGIHQNEVWCSHVHHRMTVKRFILLRGQIAQRRVMEEEKKSSWSKSNDKRPNIAFSRSCKPVSPDTQPQRALSQASPSSSPVDWVALANLAMWTRDQCFPVSYAHATWARLAPFFQLPGSINSFRHRVPVQLRPFNDRQYNRDLSLLCQCVNEKHLHLPDGRMLLFQLQEIARPILLQQHRLNAWLLARTSYRSLGQHILAKLPGNIADNICYARQEATVCVDALAEAQLQEGLDLDLLRSTAIQIDMRTASSLSIVARLSWRVITMHRY
jgi:hypothetical protein